ncbi:MAG: universal stress protein [Pseudobdellovibrio sp.]
MLEQSIKTIVVAVDFSAYSKTVVKQAKLLCKLWKAHLVLVHVIQDPVEYAPALYVPFPNRLSVEYYQNQIRKTYDIKGKGAEIIAKRGLPSDTILHVADLYPNSMVMAGYKGVSPIGEFFFGSTAQSLVLKSNHPVWIHRGNKVIKPEKVLIPHDLSNESNKSIDILKNLSLAAPDKYEVFFVDQYPFPVLDYAAYTVAQKQKSVNFAKISKLKNEYPELHFVAGKGNLKDKIVKKAKRFDMLVMAHHHPSGFFTGSDTVDILKLVNKPALIVQ